MDGQTTDIKAVPSLVGKTVIFQNIQLDEDTTYNVTFLIIQLVPGSDLSTDASIDIYFPDLLAYKSIYS